MRPSSRASPGGYRNLPPFISLERPSQAPDALSEEIERAEAQGDLVEWAFYDGKIYLFASCLESEERAEHVLRPRGDPDTLLSDQRQHPRARADERRAALKLKSTAEAVEEVLVNIPQSELPKLKGWDRLVAFLRNWFARHGFQRLADRLNAARCADVASRAWPPVFFAIARAELPPWS